MHNNCIISCQKLASNVLSDIYIGIIILLSVFSDVEFSTFLHTRRKIRKQNGIYEISQVVYGAALSSIKVERVFSGFALLIGL